jgi:hypothetical protein
MPSLPHRRLLLRRGLAGLATLFGLQVGRKAAVASVEPAPVRAPTTLHLYGERRPSACARAPLSDPSGHRAVARGVLLDAPDGSSIGEFYTHGLGPVGALGVPVRAASALEIQTLQLADGMLLTMGAPAPACGADRISAVVGGTGRFVGASGSCVERSAPTNARGYAPVEFVLTLLPEVPHGV